MMRNGTVYQLPNLARTITEIGSGLLPTPRACSAMAATFTVNTLSDRRIGSNLEEVIAHKLFLPTPTANPSKRELTGGENISHQSGVKYGITLYQMAKAGMLPTPTARNYKGARSTDSLEKAGRDGTNSLPDAFAVSQISARLNPLFVERLMGYPDMHTG